MSNTEHLDILYKLKKEVEKSNNQTLVHSINQMIKKVYLDQYTGTFVGHFSAGKSTLVNLILEQNILPSSPVPTTSNTAIVSVSEEPGIVANLDHQRYTLLDNYEQVKQMNRENVNVESVEIKFTSNKFSNGFTLQDTPGVDSNVSTHQSSIEQFMYTSNIIFYTVDYNHVQSALNFQFMKRLNQNGIPVVFVINQIDKHSDDELSFEAFKERVELAIQEWDLSLERIFYVSKYDHPHNEIDALSSYLVEKDQHREAMEDYVARMVQFITTSQLAYIQNEMQQLLEVLDVEESDFNQAYLTFQQNQQVSEEAQLLNDEAELATFLKNKRQDILDNAYVMTHDMRERLRLYLESRAQQFKVSGLFNKKKKLQHIQQQRLDDAIALLQEKVNQQIRQPLREDMSFLTRFINDAQTTEAILNQHYDIDPSIIENRYQPQISISNQYVLTFSDDLLKAVKQQIKSQSEPLFDEAVQHAQAKGVQTEQDQDQALYEQYVELRDLKHSLTTENYHHYYIHIDDSLDKLIDRTEIHYTPSRTDKNIRKYDDNDTTTSEIQHTSRIDTIKRALDLVEPVPLFEQTKADIRETLNRLEKKVIKIGVFGTFSAGKSSLINALLGDYYLVSSPNPTTAATTELSYGNDSAITLKSEAQLLEELNHVFEVHNVSFDSITQFLKQNVEKLKAQLEKNQLAFIRAIEKHYDMYQDMLAEGQKHTINQQEVKKWSAQDEYATFVKTVHLQLPLEWLKDKIIVDSLGLHSNNQRHTNETEKILTSSDLILYVSYFNHSFTDNDKKFIEHMKQMNQLNENQAFKMVVNAVDLAESDEDKAAVIDYVKDALAQVQLNSDIYAVSSRSALAAADEGVDQLRESIDHFANVTSKDILQQQMIHQLTHINQAYRDMIDEYQTNRAQIEQRKQKLTDYARHGVMSLQTIQTVGQRSQNEVEDQIYHLTERLKLYLLDDAKAFYNTQMTQNSDFSQEKRLTTKAYLDHIHQRLYLEQSLLVERTKKYFTSELKNEIAPLKQALEQLHVFIDPSFSELTFELDRPYVHIELNDLLSRLPKSLNKKNLLNSKKQQALHEEIVQHTMLLLQSGIAQLRTALVNGLTSLQQQSEATFEALEQDTQSQITQLLSVDIDATLINQLETTHRQLSETLQI
ncbi:dynamin family protein [Staphylococcus auricularis]|uniref:dynamin family protein n=1 Tax=Staphylococcus auricularis TaxID=29379 RepID=UPI001BCCB527|nr:dynamin family protein [Staphylococcus auricularis]MCG7341941.1 dynamin family protein [Staphylococcus auricularis]